MFEPALNALSAVQWHVAKELEFKGIHRLYDQLKHEKSLTHDAWRALLAHRLRTILTHAYERVPYYRRVFSETGFDPQTARLPDDMEKLPILTKSIIRSSRRELIAEGVDFSRLVENATGGSTGEPLVFFQDAGYLATAAALDAYVRGWWGVRPYDRTAAVWGADREFHELSIKEKLYQWRSRVRTLNAFRMTEQDLELFCDTVERWAPPYLMGYSSALEGFARHLQKNGLKRRLRFKAIRSSAETLWPHQRQLLEDTFDRSPVYNFYGSREVNNLAAECAEERRLHLVSSWRYVEIVDSEGRPSRNGESGYITVTDLSNFGMPFIRYRNEDIGAFAETRCDCGIPTPVIENLLGRSSDLVRAPNGDVIHGEFFTHLFYGVEGIKQFQLHQTAVDRITLRYVSDNDTNPDTINDLVSKIDRKMGGGINICVQRCKDIPTTVSGKFRFTISDLG